MIFSSNIFAYGFLPIVLVLYLLIVVMSKKQHSTFAKNLILLCGSLIFYLWGSGVGILILLFSIAINYIIAILIDKYQTKRLILGIGLVGNLGLLAYYKYAGFIVANMASIFNTFETQAGFASNIVLPIGISFFTFQGVSYLVDVYRGDIKAEKNPLNVALYISFFPQLIAGPIVRCTDVINEIHSRRETVNDVYEGAFRFCGGLAKKVIIADNIAIMVDKIFALPFSELSTPLAWLGILGYTIQIYYDFSAYSDMAIGLARIFGFHYKENFMLPYSSKNITEFWRRWHISLSSWFRDYLYIPLGGNRKGQGHTYLNLAIVFVLCGLWHGASWMFVIWGAYHGLLLVIERVLKNQWNFEMKGIVGNVITFTLVMFGWLFFRSDSLNYFYQYMMAMLGRDALQGFQYYTFEFYLSNLNLFLMILALVMAVLPCHKLKGLLNQERVKGVATIVCLLLSMFYMSDATFNPFIYFQF